MHTCCIGRNLVSSVRNIYRFWLITFYQIATHWDDEVALIMTECICWYIYLYQRSVLFILNTQDKPSTSQNRLLLPPDLFIYIYF